MTDYSTNITAVNGQIPNYASKVQVSGGNNVPLQYGKDKFELNSNPAPDEANDAQAVKVREAAKYMENQKSLSDVRNLQNNTEAVKFMKTPEGNIVPVFEITKDGKVLPRRTGTNEKNVSVSVEQKNPSPVEKSDENPQKPSQPGVSYESRYLMPGNEIKEVKDDPENHLYVPSTVPSKISASVPEAEIAAQELLRRADIAEQNAIKAMRSVC